MNIVLSFSALCILLMVGKILRVEIRLFQKLYLPASVIGGLLGLVLVQTIGGSLPEATMAGWNQLPGFLINIVFAALFLGVFIPPIRRIWGIAGPQLAYGQIVAWGQYVVGLGVAIVLLTPMFGVPGDRWRRFMLKPRVCTARRRMKCSPRSTSRAYGKD